MNGCMADKLHKKEVVIWFLGIMIVFILVLCLFLSWHEMRIKTIDVSDLKEPDPSTEIVHSCLDSAFYELDLVKEQTDMLTVKGWCFIEGKKTSPIVTHVLLEDVETGQYLQLPTTVVKRTDVTSAYYNEDNPVNYDYSGFSVYMDGKDLELGQKEYNMALLYKVGEDAYLIPMGELTEKQET